MFNYKAFDVNSIGYSHLHSEKKQPMQDCSLSLNSSDHAVALISAVFTYYYKSMAFVAFIMAVVGTMLRVAKNVMQSAVEIRRENDLTI